MMAPDRHPFVSASTSNCARLVGTQRRTGHAGDITMLTKRLSRLQARARFSDDTGAAADYIVEEMARALLDADWRLRLVWREPRRDRARAAVITTHRI